jgi:hypothetical protein
LCNVTLQYASPRTHLDGDEDSPANRILRGLEAVNNKNNNNNDGGGDGVNGASIQRPRSASSASSATSSDGNGSNGGGGGNTRNSGGGGGGGGKAVKKRSMGVNTDMDLDPEAEGKSPSQARLDVVREQQVRSITLVHNTCMCAHSYMCIIIVASAIGCCEGTTGRFNYTRSVLAITTRNRYSTLTLYSRMHGALFAFVPNRRLHC